MVKHMKRHKNQSESIEYVFLEDSQENHKKTFKQIMRNACTVER